MRFTQEISIFNPKAIELAVTSLSTSITQTAEEIRLEAAETLSNYSTTVEINAAISTSASAITSEVSETYATITTTNALSTRITQNANSISSEVTNRTNADTALSTRIAQTAKSISFTLSKSGEQTAVLSMSYTNEGGSTTTLSSQSITFSGLVTFTNLSTSGSTTINGGNITTGTIKGASLILGGSSNTYGTLTIKDASDDTIGTWNRTGITVYAGVIRLGSKTSLTDANTGLYLSSGGIALGASKTFYVDSSGNLTATSATVSGKITSTSGTIGGWTLASNLLSSGSSSTYVGLSSNYSASSNIAIWCGSSTASSAPFSVTRAGALTATSGTVGGWTLSSTQIYKQTAVTSGTASTQYKAYINAPSSPSSTGNAFAVAYRSYDGSSYGSYSYPFYVRYDGYLKATNADITGTITATKGYIGDFQISNGVLLSGSGTSYVRLDANQFYTYAIMCGGSSASSAPFTVTKAGAVTASNISITGGSLEITSAYGSYSGTVHIGTDGLRVPYIRFYYNSTELGAIVPDSSTDGNSSGMRLWTGRGFHITGETYETFLCEAVTKFTDNVYNSSGSVEFSSDRRKKENITYIDPDECEKFVMSLKPARFNYIGKERVLHGFIAQDVQEQIKDDWNIVGNSDGFLSINYHELIADLTGAIQALNKRITELERRTA